MTIQVQNSCVKVVQTSTMCLFFGRDARILNYLCRFCEEEQTCLMATCLGKFLPSGIEITSASYTVPKAPSEIRLPFLKLCIQINHKLRAADLADLGIRSQKMIVGALKLEIGAEIIRKQSLISISYLFIKLVLLIELFRRVSTIQMNLEQFEVLNISAAGPMISTSSQFLPISQDNPFVPALESIASSQSEVLCTQLSKQAEDADIGIFKEECFDEVAIASTFNCSGTDEYISPSENEELQRKREKVREVKRERAMRKEEQLKEASKKRLSHHLQKMQASNSHSVPVVKAPSIQVVCHKPKRYDAVSWLIPCQRKNYEEYMGKLQKENERKRKEQVTPSRSKENFIQLGPEETKSYSEFLAECHPDFSRNTCKGGFPTELVCMESGCNGRAFHCAKTTCEDCTEEHGLCNLKVNAQMFATTFEKNLERQSAVLRQYEYTEKSIMEAIRRNRKLVIKLAIFQGADQELLKKLESREKQNGKAHLNGSEIVGFLKSVSEESRHRADREIKVCESLIKSQHEILLNLDRHARMLIEPFQISDFTILDSRLVRNKGEIRFVLEELNFPLSLSLLYRASQHQFSISEFHEACDSQTETFTILKTEHGKLIGGFTPLKWGDKTYRDKQNRTFLLAINLKERLDHINHGESAIHTDSSLGPSFGGIFDKRDIEVFQKAGITFCRTSFPNSFNWKKFFTPSQESRRFLTGVEEGNTCRVVDYEVFKVRPRIGQKL